MLSTIFLQVPKIARWYYSLYVQKQIPVIIFAPGRVGSMALHKNLQDAGVFVFKLEFYDENLTGSARFIKKHIFEKRKPAKIITIVREPISMMSSYFFSKLAKGHIPFTTTELQPSDVDALHRVFLDKVLETERLERHLYWFENDFRKAIGIDVFAHSFDTNSKTGTIHDKLYPTLIFRTDLDNSTKEMLVRDFIGVTDLVVTKDNTREQKGDSSVYKKFTETLKLPTSTLTKIYQSPLGQHFFTPAEIAGFLTKYNNKV